MPRSPKELERVTEEADVDVERAELEDTGPQEKASRSRSSKPLPDIPINTEFSTTTSFPINTDFSTTASFPINTDFSTTAPFPINTDFSTTTSSANSSTYQWAERRSAITCPQVRAVPSCPVPSKPGPIYSLPIDPPPRTPPAQTAATDQDSKAMAPNPRRKVNSSAYSILCEEEESIFPTRKWTKPLSDMGDASKWKIGVLQKFSAIEY